MAKAQCVSVIDEAQNGTPQSTYDATWTTFRNDYPDRQFWLLQPGGPSRGTLKVPTAYTNDPDANGPITVNRDNNVDGQESDWFSICQFNTLPEGTVVSVFIDTSGSMTLNTVQKSYDKFNTDCAAAGIDIVYDTQSGGERWIQPHIKDIPPSVNFEVNPTEIQLGTSETAELSWLVFGDVNTTTIDNGIGVVTDPQGSITVQPTVTTTYTITSVGDAGTTTRSVTLTVNAPPLPTINSFTIDPIEYINPGVTEASWSVSGILISNINITWPNGGLLDNLAQSGTANISPQDTGTVTLTATNPSGSVTAQQSLTVYEPVVATISADPNPSTGPGIDTDLEWNVTGSASSASIDPPIGGGGNVVLTNGVQTIAPTETITYTITATGPGGTDTDSVTVVVYQAPQLSVSFPAAVVYGNQYDIPVTYDFATQGVTIELKYYTRDKTNPGTLVENTATSTLGGTASDEFTGQINATYTTNIPWTDDGPFKVKWIITANGNGGSITDQSTLIDTVIDREPAAFTLPETDDVFPTTDPVQTPPPLEAISDPIIIDNIDISVEIKADEPIQVRFDDDDPDFDVNWKSLREL